MKNLCKLLPSCTLSVGGISFGVDGVKFKNVSNYVCIIYHVSQLPAECEALSTTRVFCVCVCICIFGYLELLHAYHT